MEPSKEEHPPNCSKRASWALPLQLALPFLSTTDRQVVAKVHPRIQALVALQEENGDENNNQRKRKSFALSSQTTVDDKQHDSSTTIETNDSPRNPKQTKTEDDHQEQQQNDRKEDDEQSGTFSNRRKQENHDKQEETLSPPCNDPPTSLATNPSSISASSNDSSESNRHNNSRCSLGVSHAPPPAAAATSTVGQSTGRGSTGSQLDCANESRIVRRNRPNHNQGRGAGGENKEETEAFQAQVQAKKEAILLRYQSFSNDLEDCQTEAYQLRTEIQATRMCSAIQLDRLEMLLADNDDDDNVLHTLGDTDTPQGNDDTHGTRNTTCQSSQ